MRRANGTGSIVNLGPNRRNRYAVRVSYLERPGLWKQKYLSYHRTAKEAQEALDKYLASNIPAKSLAVTWGGRIRSVVGQKVYKGRIRLYRQL